MLKGDVVQALRSTRAIRLSGLTLGVAALAATGLLAGGSPSHGPAASATASAAAARNQRGRQYGRQRHPPRRAAARSPPLPAHPPGRRAGSAVRRGHRPDLPALGRTGHAVHGEHRQGRHHGPVALALPVPDRDRPGQHAVLHQVPAAEHDHHERQRGRDLAVLLLRGLHHAHPVQHPDPDPAHQGRLPDAHVLRVGQHHDHGPGPGRDRPDPGLPQRRPGARREGVRPAPDGERGAGPALGRHLRPVGYHVRRPRLRHARPGRDRRPQERLEVPAQLRQAGRLMPLAGQQHRLGPGPGPQLRAGRAHHRRPRGPRHRRARLRDQHHPGRVPADLGQPGRRRRPPDRRHSARPQRPITRR